MVFFVSVWESWLYGGLPACVRWRLTGDGEVALSEILHFCFGFLAAPPTNR